MTVCAGIARHTVTLAVACKTDGRTAILACFAVRSRGAVSSCCAYQAVVTGRALATETRDSINTIPVARAYRATFSLVQLALVDVCAAGTVAGEPSSARACVASNSVGAVGVGVASVRAIDALVDVAAGKAVARESTVARACVASSSVNAVGVGVASVRAIGALIVVAAGKAVARESSSARAFVASNRVGAIGIGVASVRAIGAFVNVSTLANLAVPFKTSVASAGPAVSIVLKRCSFIFAGGVVIALAVLARIDVSTLANLAVAFKTRVASACPAVSIVLKRCSFIFAGGIVIAYAVLARVDVCTSLSIPFKASVACTFKASNSVGTTCIGIAVVERAFRTFVDVVFAIFSIVACVALARICVHAIHTFPEIVAVLTFALVYVGLAVVPVKLGGIIIRTLFRETARWFHPNRRTETLFVVSVHDVQG